MSSWGLRTAPLLKGAWRAGFQRVSSVYTINQSITRVRGAVSTYRSRKQPLPQPLLEVVRLLSQKYVCRGPKGWSQKSGSLWPLRSPAS